MGTKLLQIHGDDGAGKKTLLGRLIYQFGLELPQLEQLEQNGIKGYGPLVSFYEKENIPQSFYAPSARFVIDKNETPDTAIWVVDATVADNGRASSQQLASLISAGKLQPKENLVIVVNKMDLINWREQDFREFVQSYSSVGSIAGKTSIIPVSAQHGSNILGTPEEALWIKEISPSSFAGSGLVSIRSLVDSLS